MSICEACDGWAAIFFKINLRGSYFNGIINGLGQKREEVLKLNKNNSQELEVIDGSAVAGCAA
jgi:hypothetical protein